LITSVFSVSYREQEESGETVLESDLGVKLSELVSSNGELSSIMMDVDGGVAGDSKFVLATSI